MINQTQQTSEPRVIRLVRTSDDLRSVEFGDYDRVVVAIGNQEKDGNDAATQLFQQRVKGYQIQSRKTNGIKELGIKPRAYVDVREMSAYQQLPAVAQTPSQRRLSCEMQRPVKGMSVEEITEICAQLPPGVGEEEYLARMNELGDAI